MKRTKAAAAFARLSSVLTMLHAHPRGLRLDYLAEQVGVPETLLREELLAYYAADTLSVRPDTIVFVSSDGQEDDPHSAEIVRVVSDRPTAELGVEMMSPEEWVRTYEAAAWVHESQPDNADLAAAIEIIRDRIVSGSPARPDSDVGTVVAKAVQDRTYLDLEYSRAWKPGVVSRHVAPLRLVQTSHGWELDALLDGDLRTFLIDRIRSARPTTQTFTPPPDADARLAAHRTETAVRLSIPQGWLWLVDRYAQNSIVEAQDEDDVTVVAQFLPPVPERVGLILVSAPGSFVVEPSDLNDAGPAMAQVLLEHHGL
ncbi:MAG: WYL domain-containing protein [Candidatus Nanopelagicales bacterium]